MAALVGAGAFGLVGLFRYSELVRWGSPGAWVVVPVLLAFLGLGLSGLGVSVLLDPPEVSGVEVSGVPTAVVVRPARTT